MGIGPHEPYGVERMRKFFKYILPLALIVLSIILVVVMVGIATSKRPATLHP